MRRAKLRTEAVDWQEFRRRLADAGEAQPPWAARAESGNRNPRSTPISMPMKIQ